MNLYSETRTLRQTHSLFLFIYLFVCLCLTIFDVTIITLSIGEKLCYEHLTVLDAILIIELCKQSYIICFSFSTYVLTDCISLWRPSAVDCDPGVVSCGSCGPIFNYPHTHSNTTIVRGSVCQSHFYET